MMQSFAILLDSVRELRSKSLFWIALFISLVVSIALFGLIGFTEAGWRILWFEPNESEWIRQGSPGARSLVSMMFSLFVRFWVCWGAIILALITTASVLPNFLSAGAIDLSLSKPISRVWIFLVKVLGTLLFVLVQASICTIVAFMLMGARGEVWIPEIFWAIPLVMLQFFYLYCFSSLVAVVTRSTLATLLLTLIVWGSASGVQFASNKIDGMVAQYEFMIERQQEHIDAIHVRAEAEQRPVTIDESVRVQKAENMKRTSSDVLDMISKMQPTANALEWVVPRTGDIQKIIANVTDAPSLNEFLQGSNAFESAFEGSVPGMTAQDWKDAEDAAVVHDQVIRAVDAPRSIGASLAISLLFLTLALILFYRRDF